MVVWLMTKYPRVDLIQYHISSYLDINSRDLSLV